MNTGVRPGGREFGLRTGPPFTGSGEIRIESRIAALPLSGFGE